LTAGQFQCGREHAIPAIAVLRDHGIGGRPPSVAENEVDGGAPAAYFKRRGTELLDVQEVMASEASKRLRR
jgi:hypothetical protein